MSNKDLFVDIGGTLTEVWNETGKGGTRLEFFGWPYTIHDPDLAIRLAGALNQWADDELGRRAKEG